MCFCLPKHHMKFTCKNRLSSFSRMHTTLTRERRFDSTDRSWPLLGFHDARGYTLTNLSFTAVKRWVTKNEDVMTKKNKKYDTRRSKNTHTHTKKKDLIVVFWLHGHPKTSVLLKPNHRLRILTSKDTVSWGSFVSTSLSGKSNFFMSR